MVVMVMMAVLLVAVCVAAVWPWPDDSPGAVRSGSAAAGRGNAADASGPADTRTAPLRISLEGVLVDQLVSGEITRSQYLHEMDRLAAREAERFPLRVPGDD